MWAYFGGKSKVLRIGAGIILAQFFHEEYKNQRE